MPPPTLPSRDASPATVLAFERQNLWAACIRECRFFDRKLIYLWVNWILEPEDLPMGRRPYHDQRELIMSNIMDIIEADTIACLAEITKWDEKDDQQSLRERYWRQTFDTCSSRRKNKLAGLSKVMTYCSCNSGYNPDERIYQCRDCHLSNHERCIEACAPGCRNGCCLGCNSRFPGQVLVQSHDGDPVNSRLLQDRDHGKGPESENGAWPDPPSHVQLGKESAAESYPVLDRGIGQASDLGDDIFNAEEIRDTEAAESSAHSIPNSSTRTFRR